MNVEAVNGNLRRHLKLAGLGFAVAATLLAIQTTLPWLSFLSVMCWILATPILVIPALRDEPWAWLVAPFIVNTLVVYFAGLVYLKVFRSKKR